MHGLYVKEFREPKYSEVRKSVAAKEPDSASKMSPGKKYNLSYLPNGQQVEIKSFEDQ